MPAIRRLKRLRKTQNFSFTQKYSIFLSFYILPVVSHCVYWTVVINIIGKVKQNIISKTKPEERVSKTVFTTLRNIKNSENVHIISKIYLWRLKKYCMNIESFSTYIVNYCEPYIFLYGTTNSNVISTTDRCLQTNTFVSINSR